MIWNKKTANVGDTKTITRFALFPTEVDEPEYTVVWFQKYKVDLVYREYGREHMPFAWGVRKRYI